MVTFAQSVPALTRPEMETTHAGATVDARDVETGPVSGVGEMPTRPLEERPNARPVMKRSLTVADAEAGR